MHLRHSAAIMHAGARSDVERNPFAHVNEDIGEVGQRLFAEYLDLQAIKWEYEAVEGNAKLVTLA